MPSFFKRKHHYAWAVAIGCACLFFATSGLGVNGYAVYQPFLMKYCGFSNTQLSVVLSFRNAMTLLSILLSGYLFDRLSLRLVTGIAGACSVTGYALLGVAAYIGNGPTASGNATVGVSLSVPFIIGCVSLTLIGIGFGLGGSVPVTLAVSRWFVARRNTVLGLCSAVTGLSTIGIPSVITQIIDIKGLSTALMIQALVMALFLLPAVILLRDSPDVMKKPTKPYGYTRKTADAANLIQPGGKAKHTVSAGEWIFIIPALLMLGGVMNLSYTDLPLLAAFDGFSESDIALAVTVGGLTLLSGKLLFGWISDKLSTRRAHYIIFPLLLLGGTLLLFMSGSVTLYHTAVVFDHFGFSLLSVGLGTWAVELSNDSDRPKNIRRFQALYASGSLIFAPICGGMADAQGGSYQGVYILFLCMSAFIAVVMSGIYIRRSRIEKRDRQA